MKKPWRSIVSGLLPMDFSACFIFIKDHFLRSGIIPCELNLPHQLLNKKKKYQYKLSCRKFLWSHFLKWYFCVKITYKIRKQFLLLTDASTISTIHLRFREHHRTRNRNIVKVIGPRYLLENVFNICI